MSPEERRRLLGDDIVEHIRAEVAAAPPPTADVIARLRLILTRPGRRASRPAA